jgi:lipopolysaccharide transport system permease protein
MTLPSTPAYDRSAETDAPHAPSAAVASALDDAGGTDPGSAPSDESSALARQSAPGSILVIRPTRGWRSVDLRELWACRELLYFLCLRDIKVRYKQTVLGAAWTIMQPVMTMIVFAVFFGRVAGLSSQSRVPYPLFVYAALLPWQLFATSVTQSASSLVASAHLISKVYFPRLIVPLATIGVSLVDFAISLLVMLGLIAWYRVPLSLSAVALPFCLVGTLVVSLGFGIGLAALTVAYRDFRHAVPFLVQIWMFASPVAYSFEKIPESFRLFYALNPMAGLISAYRSALLSQPFHWDAIAVSSMTSLALFLGGLLYFCRVERRFADIV